MTFMMSSCATILTSSYDTITFSSSDGGSANVKIVTPVEGERIITLPTTLKIRKRNYKRDGTNNWRITVLEDQTTESTVQTGFFCHADPIAYLGFPTIISPIIDLISQKGNTCGSKFVVNVKRKQTYYSAPGSITDVKYE